MPIKMTEIDFEKSLANLPGEPTPGRVILKRCEIEGCGDIIIPDGSREKKKDEGVVIKVGKGVTYCKPKDIVFFGKYAGTPFVRNEELFYLLNEEDVIYREESK